MDCAARHTRRPALQRVCHSGPNPASGGTPSRHLFERPDHEGIPKKSDLSPKGWYTRRTFRETARTWWVPGLLRTEAKDTDQDCGSTTFPPGFSSLLVLPMSEVSRILS